MAIWRKGPTVTVHPCFNRSKPCDHKDVLTGLALDRDGDIVSSDRKVIHQSKIRLFSQGFTAGLWVDMCSQTSYLRKLGLCKVEAC